MKLARVRGHAQQPDEWPLDETRENIIGRRDPPDHQPDIDLWPDRSVSRRHARVWYKDNTWWIEDVGSKHGTQVGEQEIKGDGAFRLPPGVEIKLGETVLVLDPPHRHRTRWGDLVVEVDCTPAVNYSLIHCNRPLISRVAVRNRGNRPSDPLRLDLSIPGYIDFDSLFIPSLEPGGQEVIAKFSLSLQPGAFERQLERQLAQMTVSLEGHPIMTFNVWILAHNEWSQEEAHRLTTASFVQPNHPLIRQIELEARETLRQITEGRFDCFHSLLKSDLDERVEKAVRALYEYLRTQWDLQYRYEPPSFESNSQKVRLPHEVLSDLPGHRGQGTCIDLVLLLAACLEWVDARPLVVMVETQPGWQHALLACWREEQAGAGPLITDQDEILRSCVLVECTGYARKSDAENEPPRRLDFETACEEARRRLEDHRFLYALDITAARADGITPLPFAGQPQDSPGAAQVARRAPEIAQTFGIPYLGTVHLLLALIEQEKSLASQALRDRGIDPAWAQQRLQEGLQMQGGKKVIELKPTRHYDQTWSSARALAKRQGSAFVLDEHLLLSLLDIRSPALDNALKALKTTREELLEAVRRIHRGVSERSSYYSVFSQFPSTF